VPAGIVAQKHDFPKNGQATQSLTDVGRELAMTLTAKDVSIGQTGRTDCVGPRRSHEKLAREKRFLPAWHLHESILARAAFSTSKHPRQVDLPTSDLSIFARRITDPLHRKLQTMRLHDSDCRVNSGGIFYPAIQTRDR
jgi:hypothetical protein